MNRRNFLRIAVAAPAAPVVAPLAGVLPFAAEFDPHAALAREVFSALMLTSPAVRERAKWLAHAYNYGMSPDRIRDVMGTPWPW